jgi:NTP pyrophosphatase (non-canonical NTP hydrolase)
MKNILYYQEMVTKTITGLGGYWRPLSALVRVVEEIGEFGDLLYNFEEDKKNSLSNELSDVFIISTCLANQYCANMNDKMVKLGYTGNVDSLYDSIPKSSSYVNSFLELTIQAAKIARILNYYEGDKNKESITSIAGEIAKLQIIIVEIAKFFDIELFSEVKVVLEKNLKRDKGRFGTFEDPTTSESLKRFGNIVRSTDCIFATRAKIWGSFDYNQSMSIEENMSRNIGLLERFNKVAFYEGLDGFVIEVLGDDGDTLINLSDTVRRVLKYFSDNDPSGIHCMDQDKLRPDWRFSFGGKTFFITTFAPCYPENHPRHSKNPSSVFIFLQPEFSFDHHGIHSGACRKTHLHAENVHKKVRFLTSYDRHQSNIERKTDYHYGDQKCSYTYACFTNFLSLH